MAGEGSRSEQRAARAAALRKEQKASERRRTLITGAVVLAGVVVAGAVITVAATRGGSSSSSASDAGQVVPLAIPDAVAATKEAAPTVIADTSGIDGVVAYKAKIGTAAVAGALPATHVQGPVDYSLTPPVGGDHNAIWMNCGVYTKPVPSERAVHDMEHGAVWITYRPSLAKGQVALLRKAALAPKEISDASGNAWRYMDLTPWSSNDLPAPIVLSAWGRQLKLDSASDPRIQRFIDAFRVKQGVTPEFGSACGGEPVDEGGQPAAS